MVTIEHEGVPVEWEEKQYDIFQDIKQENNNNPEWVAPIHRDPLDGERQMNVTMSPVLADVVVRYAKKNDISIAKLVRETLCDVVCSDDEIESMLDVKECR